MTLVTGKSGQYRYYKCTTRVNKGNALCGSANIPMERLDDLVLGQLANRVFKPDRHKIAKLQTEVRKADERLGWLYEAVETGVLPLDETLQRRVKHTKNDTEAVLIEMAGLRRLQPFLLYETTQPGTSLQQGHSREAQGPKIELWKKLSACSRRQRRG